MNYVNPLSANPTKYSNTLKQFAGKLPPSCLSVFDHFVGLALNGLKKRFLPLNEWGNRLLIIFNFGLRLYFGTNSQFKYLLLGGTFYGYCYVHVF